MSENQTSPSLENEVEEAGTEQEEGSGLKIRTNLKAGLGENMLAGAGIASRVYSRDDAVPVAYNYQINLVKIY